MGGLRDAGSWDERFAIAQATLVGRGQVGRTLDPEVAFTWRRMADTGGQVRVEQLADENGWIRKRLWSRFRAQVGLTPKRAAKLVRFDPAAHRLAAGRSAASVAAGGGFVDQSHLCRDVKDFTGLTPASVAHALRLAVDEVAWPIPGRGSGRALDDDRGDYGLDGDFRKLSPRGLLIIAATIVAVLIALTAILGTVADAPIFALVTGILAVAMVLFVISYIHTTRVGKFVVWSRVLGDLRLRGDEEIWHMWWGAPIFPTRLVISRRWQ